MFIYQFEMILVQYHLSYLCPLLSISGGRFADKVYSKPVAKTKMIGTHNIDAMDMLVLWNGSR